MANTFQTVKRALAIGFASALTNHYVASFVICTGQSMEPTLQTQDVLITDRISPRMGWIDVGDVVIARSPNNDRVCKRVAAKHGDLVIYQDMLYQIPKGHVWLLGDNILNSKDSRTYGPVRMDQIKSRCLFRIYPDINLSVLYEFQPLRRYTSPGDWDHRVQKQPITTYQLMRLFKLNPDEHINGKRPIGRDKFKD